MTLSYPALFSLPHKQRWIFQRSILTRKDKLSLHVQLIFVRVIEGDMTLATDLTAIETAISIVLTSGQTVTAADGKSLTRASLADLYAQKERIESEIARNSTTTVNRTVCHY